jgi:hypothetical protein
MSLQALLGALGGLVSEKAIAAVAGVTLTASGAAGLATVLDNAPADTPNFQQIAQEAEEQTNDFEVQNDEAAPDDNAADVAKEIHEYKSDDRGRGLRLRSWCRGHRQRRQGTVGRRRLHRQR